MPKAPGWFSWHKQLKVSHFSCSSNGLKDQICGSQGHAPSPCVGHANTTTVLSSFQNAFPCGTVRQHFAIASGAPKMTPLFFLDTPMFWRTETGRASNVHIFESQERAVLGKVWQAGIFLFCSEVVCSLIRTWGHRAKLSLEGYFFNMQSHNSATIHQKEMDKAFFQGNFGQHGERNSKHKGKNQWIRNDFQAQQPTPPHGQSWSSFCWFVPHSAARLQLHGGIAHRAGLGELLTRRTRKFPDS